MSIDVPRAACLKLLGYIKNGNRELLVEAHHLIGKFLDKTSVFGNQHNKKTLITKCKYCGKEMDAKQKNKNACNDCKAENTRQYYAEKWKNRKEEK